MSELLLSEEKGVKTYLSENSKWGKAAVCKVLDTPHPSEAQLRNFFHEYELLANLQIEGVRKPLGKDELYEKPAAFYTYFEGLPLKKLIQAGKNDLKFALKASIFISEILLLLHEEKVIHKGISSNNILYNPEIDEFCLIDFSNASTIEQKKLLLGNPEYISSDLSYISPEQTGRMNRFVDSRSDLYSAGIVLYELFTGLLPFQETDPYEIVYDHIALTPERPDAIDGNVPKIIGSLIMKLLEKDADNRYQSALGLRFDLQKIQDMILEGDLKTIKLGEFDFSSDLRISQKLYGRDRELQQLSRLFLGTAQGDFNKVLVKGTSGTGKSALVHEVYRSISKNRGYFVGGKYDQLQRNIPYYALRDAIKEYVFYLLTEKEEVISQTREKILEFTGNEAGIITGIFPEIGLIIGPTKVEEDIVGIEGQNRFNYIFVQFLRAITHNGVPLVVFIDDLQWADLASINLIGHIVRQQFLTHTLFIGAYRSNEVSEGHPLSVLVNDLQKDQISIDEVEIENLEEADISQLIADSLNLTREETHSISELIFQRTEGNAFYTIQLLSNLAEKGHLFYDPELSKWSWVKNLEKELDVNENIIDLMIEKISRLDSVSQEVLKTGSCIGNVFTRNELKLILNIEEDELNASLNKIQSEGLTYEENEEFRFIHDRIQQAVYSLLNEEEKKSTHLNIGKEFLVAYEHEENKIFNVIDQLNVGIGLIVEPKDRIYYANLNLKAGISAKKSTAYDSSIKYLKNGLKFCSNDWKAQYDLTLSLHIHAAEASYLLGNYDEMDLHIDEVLGHGQNLLDKISVYKTKIEALKSQNRLAEAVEKGIEVLKMLKINLPLKPSRLQVLQKLASTKLKLLTKNVESFEFLEPMEDSYKLASMQILVSLGPAIYYSSPNLIPLTVFEMVLLSVGNGNTDESVFAYATYGLILCGVTGEIKLGDRYGFLALKLADKANAINKVKGIFSVYCFVNHWSHPLSDSFKPFKNAFQFGKEAGELEFCALSAYLYCNHLFYSGYNLKKLDKEFEVYTNEIRNVKQNTPLNYALLHWQTVKNLQSKNKNPVNLNGPVYDENEKREQHLEAKDKTALFKYYLLKAYLNYLFGNNPEAAKMLQKGEKYMDAVTGMYVTVMYYFVNGLVHIALSETSDSKTFHSEKRIKDSMSKFKSWSISCPDNNEHKYLLLQAEYARIHNQTDTAARFYDEAIESSLKYNFENNTSLAYELTGKFYHASKRENLAKYYLKLAVETYQSWGAEAKATELSYIYDLETSKGIESVKSDGPSAISLENVDIHTVIQASQAISSEIEFDKLKNRLLKIMTENAGAEHSALFLFKDQNLSFQGSWPQDNERSYPESIINLVKRTGDWVVTDNAYSDSKFSSDPYVQERKLKSTLCLPIHYQNEPLAIVYLENNLSYNAFPSERIELLRLLSGQIAVSIRNASLYQNLQESYEEQVSLKDAYSKFVPADFLEFLGAENIVNVELADQVDRDVTIMFLDIVEYTTLSETMTPAENFNFINGCLKRIIPIISENNGFVSQFLGDGIMAIFKESGDKALIAAIGIQKKLDEWNKERLFKNRKPIRIGTGLHSGPVILGIIGDEKRMDPNVISDNVNISSRVQDLTRFYDTGVLLTDKLVDGLQNSSQFNIRFLGETAVKGRKKNVKIFESLDSLSDAEMKLKLDSSETFSKGIKHFYEGKFPDAIKKFEQVLKKNPEDLPAKRFLVRATDLMTDSRPENWPGTEITYKND